MSAKRKFNDQGLLLELEHLRTPYIIRPTEAAGSRQYRKVSRKKKAPGINHRYARRNMSARRGRFGGAGGGGGGGGVTGPAGPGGEYWDDVIVQQHFSRDGFVDDTSPSARSAANVGSVAVNGTTDRAEFNGTNQRIRVVPTASTPNDFLWSGDFAFELWNFEVQGAGIDSPISYYDAGDGQRRWNLDVRPDGDGVFRLLAFTNPGSAASQITLAAPANPGGFDDGVEVDYAGFFRNGANAFFFYQFTGGSFQSIVPFGNTFGTTDPGTDPFVGTELEIGARDGGGTFYPFEIEAYRITDSNRGVTALADLTEVPDKDFATSAS